jgi:hypothetical protein
LAIEPSGSTIELNSRIGSIDSSVGIMNTSAKRKRSVIYGIKRITGIGNCNIKGFRGIASCFYKFESKVLSSNPSPI